jgi:Recombinase
VSVRLNEADEPVTIDRRRARVALRLIIGDEMRRLRVSGATLREIAAWLAEHEILTRRGGQWAAENVRYLVANPRHRQGAITAARNV